MRGVAVGGSSVTFMTGGYSCKTGNSPAWPCRCVTGRMANCRSVGYSSGTGVTGGELPWVDDGRVGDGKCN